MKQELIIEKLNGHDTSGVVGKIYVCVGQAIHIGDTLLSIESGKGALLVKAKGEGVILEMLIEEGQTVEKGQVVGYANYETEVSTLAKPTPQMTGQGKAAYSFGLAAAVKRTLDVDLAIIGGGPGGYVAAIRGAQAGLKVAIIEADRLGGTCLNYGCIPTKSLASSVAVLNQIRHGESFGFRVPSVEIHFDQVMQRKDQVVEQLVGGIEYLMDTHGIDYIKGTAKIDSKSQLSVKDKKQDVTVRFDKLILATGSKPGTIPIEGYDLPDILTSKELLSLHEIPKSLTIIGGGVIGMEFAFIYKALGAEVTVIEYMPQILGLLDDDVIAVVRSSAVEKGIRIYEDARAASIRETLDGQKLVEIQMAGQKQFICSEKVAMAVGRRSNLESVDLDMLGVTLNERKSGIEVNGFMQTANEKIYAIGDVTNKIQLAHVASHQGIVAVDHMCGSTEVMNYGAVPGAIFTDPEVGQVGMSEREANAEGIDCLVSKFPFMANGKALAMGESKGFVKLIADSKSRIILGGAVVGIHATDLIATIGNFVALKMTIDKASHVIYAHPTTAESIHEALLMLDNRGIHFG